RLEAAWTVLAGTDAGAADRAIWDLAGMGNPAVAFLSGRLRPLRPARPEHVARLVRDLNSPRFAVREQARVELEALEEVAEAELRGALPGNLSLEERRRLERLLARLDTRTLFPERLRELRAIEALEKLGTLEARQLLAAVAAGAPGAWRTRE